MNGYSFAPADPAAEIITAQRSPTFTAIQGNQTFNVYDPDGAAVGSSTAFTTTSDILGNYTQAVPRHVERRHQRWNRARQVPPVGSVYNVCYTGNRPPLCSFLLPPSGDVISFIDVSPNECGTATTSHS